MVLPHLQFSSPLFLLLPKSFQANPFVQAAAHPALTQVQNVLGTPGGRPKAPFDYTNLWGECLTILLPFLLVWAWTGTRRQRLFAAGTADHRHGPAALLAEQGRLDRRRSWPSSTWPSGWPPGAGAPCSAASARRWRSPWP